MRTKEVVIMIRRLTIVAVILVAQFCRAQAPAGAPAGATALCNDGTYFKGATKSGACSGHKGIKTWYGAAAAAAKSTTTKTDKTASAKPAPAPASAPAAAAPAKATESTSTPAASSAKTPTSTKAQAPGGGPGLVWVNTASKVYHCPGTQYYGKTKAGAYMSEADAKAKGARPDAGKPCK
jgi:hypothetical protein